MKRQQRISVLTLLAIFSALQTGSAQCGLQSGPMVGQSDLLEATIWVQTKCAQEVQLRYWLAGVPETSWNSAPVTTSGEHGFCAHLTADQVKPGQSYEYEILIDGNAVALPYPARFQTQKLWRLQGDPPAFTFVTGSCAYVDEPEYDRPGKPYGGGYDIFNTILSDNPDMMVWLGDNTYLREVDYNSRTGIYHRYTHTRSAPAMQPLLASVHHYAIWDDHDYGPNDCDRSYWGKNITRQAFMDFWANPVYGAGGTGGITGTYFWQDCQFFLLDDRWYRGPKGPASDYLGEKQLNWLVEALRYSRASFKFICNGGQVINNAAVFENYAQFSLERQALLDSIDKYNIKGVVFLTGDRHHSEISRMVTARGNVLYDITSSALTSSTTAHPDEPNRYRIPGSMVGVRNYALISVYGLSGQRVCEVLLKDTVGNVLFKHVLEW